METCTNCNCKIKSTDSQRNLWIPYYWDFETKSEHGSVCDKCKKQLDIKTDSVLCLSYRNIPSKYILLDDVFAQLKIGDFLGNRQKVFRVTAIGVAHFIGTDMLNVEHTMKYANCDRYNKQIIFEKRQIK
jgi:hypothetical protein